MMSFQANGIVLKNKNIKSLYFLLEIYCPPIANKIKPGQFLMLKVSEDNTPLLRRPFSVFKSYSANHPEKGKRGMLSLLYKKVGKGTQKMTEFKSGQKVDVLGPLGNGFHLPPPSFGRDIILIGGGVGIVSLFPLANKLSSLKLSVWIGGKTQHDILCVNDFKKMTSNLFIATEDGSLGFKGTIIDLFSLQGKNLNLQEVHYLYSCGPLPMLRELAEMTQSHRFISQVSLEARMACGFGACWGCVVRTNDPKDPYQRVCKEGPVFNLEQIVWE
jgi:dihydroorotate dehydrogenase electron transfer subunit